MLTWASKHGTILFYPLNISWATHNIHDIVHSNHQVASILANCQDTRQVIICKPRLYNETLRIACSLLIPKPFPVQARRSWGLQMHPWRSIASVYVCSYKMHISVYIIYVYKAGDAHCFVCSKKACLMEGTLKIRHDPIIWEDKSRHDNIRQVKRRENQSQSKSSANRWCNRRQQKEDHSYSVSKDENPFCSCCIYTYALVLW